MTKKKILNLAITALMLSVSSGAWGTYYLFGGNDDAWDASPSKWSNLASNDSERSFSVTLAAGDWYMGVSESDDVNGIYGCGCDGDEYKINDPDKVTSWKDASNRGGRQVYKFGLSSAASLTISHGGLTLTIRSNTTYYTVTPANDGNCTISPSSAQSVAEGGEYTFTVTPNEGFKLSTAELTSGVSAATCTPAEGFAGSTVSKNVTISSVTGNCTFTANATARTQYTLAAPTMIGTSCAISPSSVQYVYDGDAITYTVTPATGLVYKSCSFDGTMTGDIAKSDDSFTFYPKSDGKFKVTYGTPSVYVPVARIGEMIDMSGTDVNVSAYVTSEKCSDVNEIVVYYSNNSGFRNDEGMVVKSKSFTAGAPYTLNTAHTLTLPSEDIETIVGNRETLYVRIKAHNEHGYSAYSDVVSIVYLNNNFDANPVSITPSDACDGKHEFTWSDMFLPTPTDYAVIDAFGNNVKGEFSLTKEGQMIWNVIESIGDDGTVNIKPNGTYTFTFTAKRNGYSNANAVLTINFATSGTEDAIAGIYLNDSGSPVTSDGSLTPWETATLGATESSSDIEKIGWTVSPVSGNYILTPTEGTTVYFKAKKEGEYTVTARGLTSTCGTSPAKKIVLTVNNDSEPCKP